MYENRPVYVAGLDLGVLPIGDWSILMTLSRCSSPSILSHLISLLSFALLSIKELIGSRVWLIKDDFPDPDTPVIHVKIPIGISAEIFWRLFSEELIILITLSFGATLFVGTLIPFSPVKYLAVIEFLLLSIALRSPSAQISPPCFPAPGPISIIWSAHLIASSSCSTTITVFPRLLRLFKVFINFSLSLWWRPIEGSSRTYVTPTNPEPIWLANLILWASPPDNVSALLSSVR